MTQIVKAPTRRKWTLAELDRLSTHGFFDEHEHVELIGGELITMAPKDARHENVRGDLADWFVERLPPGMKLRVELGWRPNGATYLEPDILIATAQSNMPLVHPDRVALIIEVAKSSLVYDHGLKAEAYAALGIADYWVINACGATIRMRLGRQSG